MGGCCGLIRREVSGREGEQARANEASQRSEPDDKSRRRERTAGHVRKRRDALTPPPPSNPLSPGFSPPLVASIAAGLSRHVKQWSKQSSAKSSASPKQLTTNDILGRINVADCSTIHSLKGIIEEVQRREKGDLRLIVLDSLAYLVRGLPTNKERTLVVRCVA